MAQKRMFDKRVTDSDKFIDLPNSSKALYFMAGMEADDRGFFQPKKLQKMCGFSDDDFKILIAKGFFITFDSGVIVITDWNKNNWLDSRRITETEYVDELKMLKLINNKYEFNERLANAKQPLREYSIEEYSIDKSSIYIVEIINYLNNAIGSNYKTTTQSTRSKIHARLKEGFTVEDFKSVIDFKSQEWKNDKEMSKYLRPETLFGTKFESYLQNSKKGDSDGQDNKYSGIDLSKNLYKPTEQYEINDDGLL